MRAFVQVRLTLVRGRVSLRRGSSTRVRIGSLGRDTCAGTGSGFGKMVMAGRHSEKPSRQARSFPSNCPSAEKFARSASENGPCSFPPRLRYQRFSCEFMVSAAGQMRISSTEAATCIATLRPELGAAGAPSPGWDRRHLRFHSRLPVSNARSITSKESRGYA
jgi:hypothetical protein